MKKMKRFLGILLIVVTVPGTGFNSGNMCECITANDDYCLCCRNRKGHPAGCGGAK